MTNQLIDSDFGVEGADKYVVPVQEDCSHWAVIDHCNTVYDSGQEDEDNPYEGDVWPSDSQPVVAFGGDDDFDDGQPMLDPLKESLYEADQDIDYREGNMPMWGAL